MTSPNGLTDVANDKVATIVTYLEMDARPEIGTGRAQTWSIIRQERPDPEWYRDLYRRIGEKWLWFSRLIITDDELKGFIHRPGTEVYALMHEGHAEGLLELHFEGAACELAFFGVTEKVQPLKAGRALMSFAIDLVWSRPVQKFMVHTCTMDHPNALPFYMRSGFRPVRRQIEVLDDPRIDGLVPVDSAPHVPVLGR